MLRNIVAIPGWGFSSAIFQGLSQGDLSVMGLDYIHAPLTSLESMARFLYDDVPDNAVLLGWSFGGLIAIQLAALFPQKVKKIILMSSGPKLLVDDHGFGIQAKQAQAFMTGFADDPNAQISHFLRLVSYPARRMDTRNTLKQHFLYQQTDALLKLLPILFSADLRETYQSLRVDKLHLVSEQDALFAQTMASAKKLFPNVPLIGFKHAGHAGFLTDHELYQQIISEFLQH